MFASRLSEDIIAMVDQAKNDDTPPVQKARDLWDKIDIIGKLLGSTLIPFALAFTGFLVSGYLQDRTAKQKAEEVAIDVLKAETVGTPLLREWAEGVFKRMLEEANSPLSPGALKDLRSNPLPSATSARSAVELISEEEGFSPVPFRDQSGFWVVGFGHVISQSSELPDEWKSRPPLTLKEGKALLEKDMAAADNAVKEAVTVNLTDGQRAALVSLAFNVGVNSFKTSTLLKIVNSGRLELVPDEIMRFGKRNGTEIPGLRARRAREIQMWNSAQ